MSFSVVGTNHRFSPLEVREKFAISRKKLRDAYETFRQFPGVGPFFILATCNRSEIYFWNRGKGDPAHFFCELFKVPREVFAPFLYQHENEMALRHWVRVLCGLDSQILGEPQVFEQARQAVHDAEGSGELDPAAFSWVSQTITLAEKIRREFEGVFSAGTVADAALALIRRNCSCVRDRKFLLIGTGKVMELFIPLLAREGIRPVIISNRHYEKAAAWASALGGTAAYLEDLSAHVAQAEIIVSATACSHILLRKENFRERENPVWVLDLAVPRDVDVSVKEIRGVQLFDLDDLSLVTAGRPEEEGVREAEQKVQKECEILWRELSGSEQEKVLSR